MLCVKCLKSVDYVVKGKIVQQLGFQGSYVAPVALRDVTFSFVITFCNCKAMLEEFKVSRLFFVFITRPTQILRSNKFTLGPILMLPKNKNYLVDTKNGPYFLKIKFVHYFKKPFNKFLLQDTITAHNSPAPSLSNPSLQASEYYHKAMNNF